MNNKANFKNSFGLLFLSVAIFMFFRWIILEPFIIPSGSMIPSLLINDHIVVAKWSYGIRLPFSKKWLTQRLPERGEVVVFSSVERDDFYMIKRVIGLPGDVIEILSHGELRVNGETVARQAVAPEVLAKNSFYPVTLDDVGQNFDGLDFYIETMGARRYTVILDRDGVRWDDQKFTVPDGHLFLMGDNRDSSRDSRFWGALPQENLVGRALFVWLSCTQTLVQVNYLCDPAHIRWQRLFYPIQ